jgi:hypothetical protein
MCCNLVTTSWLAVSSSRSVTQRCIARADNGNSRAWQTSCRAYTLSLSSVASSGANSSFSLMKTRCDSTKLSHSAALFSVFRPPNSSLSSRCDPRQSLSHHSSTSLRKISNCSGVVLCSVPSDTQYTLSDVQPPRRKSHRLGTLSKAASCRLQKSSCSPTEP